RIHRRAGLRAVWRARPVRASRRYRCPRNRKNPGGRGASSRVLSLCSRGWQTGHKFITIENVLNQRVDNTPPPAPTRRRLSEAGERVLELVRQYDAPVSVDELAERLGKHTNTVREQLNALINTGLVHRQRGEKHGRGRPAWYYVATGAQEAGREVVGLASALAGQIERNSDDPHAEAVAAGESWGSQLLAQGDDLQRSVFWVLDELGFAPQLDGSAGRMSLHACPMAEV